MELGIWDFWDLELIVFCSLPLKALSKTKTLPLKASSKTKTLPLKALCKTKTLPSEIQAPRRLFELYPSFLFGLAISVAVSVALASLKQLAFSIAVIIAYK